MTPSFQLEATGLSVGYGGREILHQVTLRIAAGEIVGLIGPNGAGKTTLLRAMSGALPLQGGAVRLAGRDLAGLSRPEAARILAMVPQTVQWPVSFCVADFVSLGRRPHGPSWAPFRDADRWAVREALEWTDLVGYEERALDELSAGERQRVFVAMALAQTPGVLLLDEPTTHLDIHHAWHLLGILRRLNRERGLTILWSSHDLNLAAAFCRRLALMDSGRLVADGPPDRVLEAVRLSAVYRHPLQVLRPAPDQPPWVVPGPE